MKCICAFATFLNCQLLGVFVYMMCVKCFIFVLEHYLWDSKPLMSVTANCDVCHPSCQAMFVVLAGFKQMSTPLDNLQQLYAAEIVKVDADEGLLRRLERGIRGLKGAAESVG